MIHRRRPTRGFTLLEVLVSIGIVSLISTLIYGAFYGMSRSAQSAEHINDRYHQGRTAIERMARELSSAFISAHERFTGLQQVRTTAFVGVDERPAARVDFTSFSHRRLRRDAHESDQNELSYFGAVDRSTGNLDLVRRESRYIDHEPTRGGVVQVMVENIESLQISYLDPISNEWVERWDSTQPAAQIGRLPSQVWIRLWIADGPGGTPVKFETKAAIPMTLPLNFGN